MKPTTDTTASAHQRWPDQAAMSTGTPMASTGEKPGTPTLKAAKKLTLAPISLPPHEDPGMMVQLLVVELVRG